MNPRRFLRTENLLASLLLTATGTATAQSTWNGTTSTNWSVAGNWAPGIPASGDDIIIANTTTTNSLTLDGTTSRTVGSITFGATGTRITPFTFSTGTNVLTINEGLVATGAFPVNTPGPTFNGNLIIGADQTWDIGGNIGSVTQDTGVFIRERSAGNLGSIVMTGDLTKIGTGQVVIAASTISGAGDFIVNNGALKLNAGSSLLLTVGGTGVIQVNNSASLFVSRNSGTMNITRDIQMNGTSTMVLSGGGTTNTSTVASNIAWGGTHTLNLGTANNSYISTGAWTGGALAVVNKTGTGAITLNGSNGGFAGTLNIQAGRVNLDSNFGGAVTLAAGATLAGEVTIAGPLSLNGGTLHVNPNSAASLGTSGNLTLTGTTALALTTPSSQNNFTVLTYTGTLTGGVANLSTAGITGYRNLTLSDATSGLITANTGASTRTWNSGAVWEAGGTGTNWLEGDQKFFNADAVTFTDTGAGTIAITGNLAPSAIVVNSNADYNFTAAANNLISGTASIVKSGTGVMTLAGANTYTGGVTVNGGTLRLGNATALGGNGQQITIANGATLDINGQFSGNRDYQISIAGTGVGGIGAIYNGLGTATSGFRSVTLTGDALVGSAAVGGTGRWDIRPITAGSGFLDLGGFTLTKSGSGTVAVVDSVIANAGNIEVTGGTFAFTRSTVSGAGTVHANTGTLLMFENYTSGTFTKDIALTDSRLRLQGSNFTLGSAITLNGTGTLDTEAARVLTIGTGLAGTGGLATIGAGTVVLTGNSSYAGTTNIGGTSTLQIGNQTATGTLGASAIANNANLVINRSDTAYEVTNDISGTGALVIGQATGGNVDSRVTLSGNNSFSGAVTVQSGGLVIKNSNALGTGPKTVTVNNGTAGSSQLYLDGSGGDISLASSISFNTSSPLITRPAIGNIAGNNTIHGNISLTAGGGNTAVSVQGGSLTLNGGISIAAATTARSLVLAGNSGSNGTVAGAISDGGNILGVEKAGTNKWTLNATNTYTGNTTISGGTLELGASGSISTSAQIIVGASTTLDVSAQSGWTVGGTQTLSGSGTIIGNTLIAGDLRPGTSPGTLSIMGDLGLMGGSDLVMELGGTSVIDFDRLVVSGNFNAGGVIQISLINGFAPTEGASFDLVDFGSFTDNNYTFNFVSAPLANGLSWDTSDFSSTGAIQVIPEPSGALLVLLGVGGLVLRRRK